MNAVGSEDVVLTAYLDEKIDLWSLEVDSQIGDLLSEEHQIRCVSAYL